MIESKQNAQVKLWKKLHSNKGRQQQGVYLIEGKHLVEEAITASIHIKELMISQNFVGDFDFPLEPIVISEEVAKEIAQTQANQGIFAVISIPAIVSYEQLFNQGHSFLWIDNIQDPGNLGTLVRTADAAGYDGIVLGEGTVDLYNDKVIRSTQGSLWHLPVIKANLVEAMVYFQGLGGKVYATGLNKTSTDYRAVSYTGKFALVIGNEGQGVQPKIMSQADDLIHIPMPGKAESLNAAISAGIIMFESLKD